MKTNKTKKAQHKQKTKKMSKTDPTNKPGVKVKRLFFRNSFQTTLFPKTRIPG